MKLATRILFLDEENQKFFGEGPYRLLLALQETGSLRQAAAQMGMAYTKALHLVHHAEAGLGFVLTTRQTGGRSGGGSQLTKQGKEFLQRYGAYKAACEQANAKLYLEYFGGER